VREEPRRLDEVFGPAVLRAPAAIGNAARECGVEGGAVDAGLPARDNSLYRVPLPCDIELYSGSSIAVIALSALVLHFVELLTDLSVAQ
jgi:hypothetical protein